VEKTSFFGWSGVDLYLQLAVSNTWNGWQRLSFHSNQRWFYQIDDEQTWVLGQLLNLVKDN